MQRDNTIHVDQGIGHSIAAADDDATPTVRTARTVPAASPTHSPPATLPENEPHAPPIAANRSELEEQIEALEGALHYMGSLHPQRDAMRQRLANLCGLLDRLDTRGDAL